MAFEQQVPENDATGAPLPRPKERGIDVISVVASLKRRLETIRCSEIKRIRRQMGQLSIQQEVAIESLTRELVRKIVDDPISTLEKAASEANARAVIDIVMRLFELHPGVTKAETILARAGGRNVEF